MNLILFESSQIIHHQHGDKYRFRTDERQTKHILEIHQAKQHDELEVGLLNGLMGTGRIDTITDKYIEIEATLNTAPPPKLPITLILALPRPKMLKRIFQTASTMGVEELILINSYRVEKSYWQSPFLKEDKIRDFLILGLEQAKDTALPEVRLEKRFKPFIEDELSHLINGKDALLAHPYSNQTPPRSNTKPMALAIGPEGGFIEYEVDKLQEIGFEAFTLGPRILKVEQAIPTLLGKLF